MEDSLTIDVHKTIVGLQALVNSLRNESSLDKIGDLLDRMRDMCSPNVMKTEECLDDLLLLHPVHLDMNSDSGDSSPELTTEKVTLDLRNDFNKAFKEVQFNGYKENGKVHAKRMITGLEVMNTQLKDILEQCTNWLFLYMSKYRHMCRENITDMSSLLRECQIPEFLDPDSLNNAEEEKDVISSKMKQFMAALYFQMDEREKQMKQERTVLLAENTALKETLASLFKADVTPVPMAMIEKQKFVSESEMKTAHDTRAATTEDDVDETATLIDETEDSPSLNGDIAE